MQLPDARQLLQKDGEFLQRLQVQTRVFNKLRGHLEKLLAATSIQEGLQMACRHKEREDALVKTHMASDPLEDANRTDDEMKLDKDTDAG